MTNYLDDNFNAQVEKKAQVKAEKYIGSKVSREGISKKNYYKKLDNRDNQAALNQMGSSFNSLDFGGTKFEDEIENDN